MFQPAIKWSGSKRSQATNIITYFPKDIDVYYEPFCGGCSVLRALLESSLEPNSYICSDLNSDLINLWKKIKENPLEITVWYEQLWLELNKDNDLERKKAFFNQIRQRLNKEHNPLDFMFIMRTTTNGMPRYNQNGEFNNSFHITRHGIEPATLEMILNEWSFLLNQYNVEFICCSYEDITPTTKDFIYMDPPYANTKGMYFGGFDINNFFTWLRKQSCNYAFSFDGKVNDIDCTYNVPIDLYTQHIYLDNGNSSFRRVIGNSTDSVVKESLYVK